jgi:hypothetical protein
MTQSEFAAQCKEQRKKARDLYQSRRKANQPKPEKPNGKHDR